MRIYRTYRDRSLSFHGKWNYILMKAHMHYAYPKLLNGFLSYLSLSIIIIFLITEVYSWFAIGILVGGIPLPIFSEWWLTKEKFSIINSFLLSSFPGSTFQGCNGLSIKYQVIFYQPFLGISSLYYWFLDISRLITNHNAPFENVGGVRHGKIISCLLYEDIVRIYAFVLS